MVFDPLIGSHFVPEFTIAGSYPLECFDGHPGWEGDVAGNPVNRIIDCGVGVQMKIHINGLNFHPVFAAVVETDDVRIFIEDAV